MFFVGYNFKMSTYSEATLPFDVHSDTDEVEFNSVNDIDIDSDTDGVEFNSVNDVDTDSDTDSDTEDIKKSIATTMFVLMEMQTVWNLTMVMVFAMSKGKRTLMATNASVM